MSFVTRPLIRSVGRGGRCLAGCAGSRANSLCYFNDSSPWTI